METILWRWSTAVQVTSAAMVAMFFIALSRSVRRPEVRLWTVGWIANAVALASTVLFWFSAPGAAFVPLLRAGYLGAKLLWLLLLAEAAAALARPGGRFLAPRTRNAIVVIYAAGGAVLLDSIPLLGLVQHVMIAGVLLLASALFLRDRSLRWLLVAFELRGFIAAVESAAYAVRLSNQAIPAATDRLVGLVVSTSSSFDTGAEWLIVLASVLVVSQRAQRELAQSNRELLAAQNELRELADRDPLTGLDNRRALQSRLREVQPEGATLLFFDLDEFKEINDIYGHAVGDECLRSFADALRASFRPDDAVFRYAGDEFLVVAPGLEPESIDARLGVLRSRLLQHDAVTPQILFSVGISELEPGGRPDEAVRRADEAMYQSKERQRESA